MFLRKEIPPHPTSPGKIAWSTWCAVILLIATVILLNLSGRGGARPDVFVPGKYGPHFPLVEVSRHGWPVTCVQREPVPVAAPPWSRLSTWRLWEGIEWFSWKGLLANLAAVVGLVVVGGICFDRWQRRRGFRFGVRELLAAVALCGALCGWLALSLAGHRRELDILKSIEAIEVETGGWVVSIEGRIEWERGGPQWLRAIAGDKALRAFDRVVAIDTTSDALSNVVKLRRLRVVRLVGAVSNRQLARLAECKHLEALDMMMVNVSDEGQSPKLDREGSEIDPDLQLPHLPRLRGLNLYDTSFLGRGLDNIPAIEHLDLTDTEIDDDGVARLSACRRLRCLSLIGTNVSDASSPVLKRLLQLQELNLTNTRVSARAVRDLRTALPNCQVTY